MPDSSPAAHHHRDPYAVFRPRGGRYVALVAAAVSVVLFVIVAITVPGPQGSFGGWALGDRLLLVALGLLIAFVLWRFATIKAVPTPEGLLVRNLATRRQLEWAEIVAVQFSGGAPWLSLDLADADTVAVMAVQKADGAFARAEASRLSALVQVNSSPRRPHEPPTPD